MEALLCDEFMEDLGLFTMSELQYIRDLFNLSLWIIGAMGAFIVMFVGWVVKWSADKLGHRLDRQDVTIKNHLDSQDATIKTQLEAHTQELNSIKQLVFEDGRAVRDMLHQMDKRVDRIEYGRRRTDASDD